MTVNEGTHRWLAPHAYAEHAVTSLCSAFAALTQNEWFWVRHHFEASTYWGRLFLSERATAGYAEQEAALASARAKRAAAAQELPVRLNPDAPRPARRKRLRPRRHPGVEPHALDEHFGFSLLRKL